jgi:hypothetical protein
MRVVERDSIRFSRRNEPPLCVNCGYSLYLREVELFAQRRHVHGRHSRTGRRDSVVFTILLHAAALILFLWWLIQR